MKKDAYLDGTSGQDRKSYSDTQDRKSYRVTAKTIVHENKTTNSKRKPKTA